MKNDSDLDLAFTRRELLAGLALGSLAPQALAQAPAGAAISLDAAPSVSRELWNWAHAQQVIAPGLAYLDTASDGPKLRAALVAEYRAREASSLDPQSFQAEVFGQTNVRRLLERLATFTGCSAEELALTGSASEALNIAANGIDLQPGDEVVTTVHEHDAGIYPWLLQAKRRGIVIKQVSLRSPLSAPEEALGRLTAAVEPRTRVLFFSHVQSTDGTVMPARELCTFARERNIVSVIDGAQAVGMQDVSLRDIGCDIYAMSLHKWFNAVNGGGLFVRSDMLDRLLPLDVDDYRGWQNTDRFGQEIPTISTLRAAWPATLRKFGTTFESLGPQWQALAANLDFFETIGKARLAARVRELALYARVRLQPLHGIEFLTPSHASMWAGVLTLKLQSTASSTLVDALSADRITARRVFNPMAAIDAVRISTHIFNSTDDIERLARTLQRYAHG
jgi:selenocysteine lyase/cysteine desulfurase